MKHCINCGAQLGDLQTACHNCGAQQPQPAQQAAPQPTYQAQPQYAAPQAPVSYGQPLNMSNWDGGVLETFITILVTSLLISVTCGIATPWAVCYLWKYIISHATIDGRRLRFDGTGGSLFVQWLIWALLSIITCGIYSFWVIPKMCKWIASNTHFA